jgi:hypothetical protein
MQASPGRVPCSRWRCHATTGAPPARARCRLCWPPAPLPAAPPAETAAARPGASGAPAAPCAGRSWPRPGRAPSAAGQPRRASWPGSVTAAAWRCRWRAAAAAPAAGLPGGGCEWQGLGWGQGGACDVVLGCVAAHAWSPDLARAATRVQLHAQHSTLVCSNRTHTVTVRTCDAGALVRHLLRQLCLEALGKVCLQRRPLAVRHVRALDGGWRCVWRRDWRSAVAAAAEAGCAEDVLCGQLRGQLLHATSVVPALTGPVPPAPPPPHTQTRTQTRAQDTPCR